MASIKNFIEELDAIVPARSKHAIIESRGSHLIASAINLFQLIRENYSEELSDDLIKRLQRSIQTGDANKFLRRIKDQRNQS